MKRSIMKKVALCLSVVLVAGLFSACGSSSDSVDGTGEVIRVGYMPASVGVPVQYAYDNGYFEEAGLNVELYIFDTGAPINEALAADELDLAASGAAMIYSLAGGNCTLLAEVCSSGGMGIYAREDSDLVTSGSNIESEPSVLGSVESVTGMEVLGELGTSSQLNVAKYTELFGLTSTDYTMVNMEAGSAYAAFVSGEADAIAAYPPYSFQLLSEGYVEITSFEAATGFSVIDPLICDTDFVESRPEDVTAFVECVVRAAEALQDDEMRYDFTYEFYASNGREYTQEDLEAEILARRYMGTAEYEDESYVFGACFTQQGDFYVENGQLTEDQIPYLYESLNSVYLNDALGIEVLVSTEE